MAKPTKGSHSLRIGRVSAAHATYLLTACTGDRKPGLTTNSIFTSATRELIAMEADGVWQPQALTLMPDHFHLIVTLGERLTLSRAMARLKSKTTACLRAANLDWQEGYHDHRWRDETERLSTHYYVFMNPVRAGLVRNGREWPFAWWRPDVWTWFSHYADTEQPSPPWSVSLP